MSGCGEMAGPVLVDYRRKQVAKICQSEKQELGEFPLSNRTLAYRAFGAGTPLLFFPGNLNSRWFEAGWETTESAALKHKVRVIMVDRPGVGLSSLPPTRSYNEFAGLIEQFTNFLNLESFHVMGFSSGGPYAFATACRLASKVSSLTLIAADGEYANPSLGVEITSMYAGYTRNDLVEKNEEIAEFNYKHLRESYEAMKNETRKAMAIRDIEEACRVSLKGVARDCILETELWDFKVPETLPFATNIYHGSADDTVPPRVAQWYDEIINPSKLHLLEGENHSLVRRHWDTILERLSNDRSRPAL